MTTQRLRLLLAVVLAALGFLVLAPHVARADTFDDIVDNVPLPSGWPNAQDIKALRPLFDCLANANGDVAAVQCFDDAKNTPGGQNLTNDLPSWFWDIADFYVDVRTGDFWGALGHLGEAAICALAQFMTGGLDICNLVKDLVNAIEKALEYVWDFFKDLAEAAWEAAKCAFTLFIDCGSDDDTPPPSPEQAVYDYYYAPMIEPGVQLVESGGDYGRFLSRIRADAINHHNPEAVVQTAENMFMTVIDARWSADIGQRILPDVAKARDQIQSPSGIADLCVSVAHDWEQHALPGGTLRSSVGTVCHNRFYENPEFVSYDKWLASSAHTQAANTLQATRIDTWCTGPLWGDHQSRFADGFSSYMAANHCPEAYGKLLCTTEGSLSECQALMGSVGQKDQCDVDLTAICTAGPNGQPLCPSVTKYDTCRRVAAASGKDPNVCHFDMTTICPAGSNGEYACNDFPAFENCRSTAPHVAIDVKLCQIDLKKICAATMPIGGLRDCTTVTDYKNCVTAATEQQQDVNQCAMDRRAAAEDLVKVILGSRPKRCSGTLNLQTPMHPGPVLAVDCPRPIQQDYCTRVNYKYDGVDLLSCTLTWDADYKALAEQAAVADNYLAANYPSFGKTTIGNPNAPGVDSLVVTVAPELVKRLAKLGLGTSHGPVKCAVNNASFVCQYKAVDYDPNGIDPPTISGGQASETYNDGTSKKPALTMLGSVGTQARVGNAVAQFGKQDPKLVNPDDGLDPGTGAARSKLVMNDGGITAEGPAARGRPVMTDGGITADMPAAMGQAGSAGGLVQGVGLAGRPAAPLATGVARPGAGTGNAMQVMSATLPSDITSADQLTVAGQVLRWGSSVTVDAGLALVKNLSNSGLCAFPVDVTAQNLGLGATGAFTSAWTNNAVPGRWPHNWISIEPQGARTERDVLALKPGDNQLQLMLDDTNQVQESNENNNIFRVKVRVTGSCTAASLTTRPTVSMQPQTLARPASSPAAVPAVSPTPTVRTPAIPPVNVGRPAPIPVVTPAMPPPKVPPVVLAPPSVPLPKVATPTTTPTPAAAPPIVSPLGRAPAPVLAKPTATPTPTPTPSPAPALRR